ncbi:MAG: hypothetical protein KJT01_14660 [Gemmatimonadetes bacterium]|nr:hypothetical protein [Gemmatimonadota bacterium]
MRGLVSGALVPTVAGIAACSAPIAAAGGGERAARPAEVIGAREERVLVASYATIEAVAVSRRFAFAAAQGGVLVYDRVRDQWLPPLGVADGLGGLPIRAMAADPVDDALWIGLPGQLRIYRPSSDQWIQLPVTGTPDVIAFERPGVPGTAGSLGFGEAWVRASGNWMRVSRAGLATPADRPPPVNTLQLPWSAAQLIAQFPALRALGSGIPLPRVGGRPPRSAPMLAASLAPDRAGDLWMGTAGGGLWQVDAFTGVPTPRPYGLLAPGVGALAPALDGVWVAGIGAPAPRAGLTYVADHLQRWRWIDGTLAVPLEGVRVAALAVRGSVAWMGTDRGVVRVGLDGEASMTRWSVLDGLPDDRVVAVAPRPEGSWVGTGRGLVFVADTGRVADRRIAWAGTSALAERAVSALLVAADTLWVGTDDGLVTITPASPLVTGYGPVGAAAGGGRSGPSGRWRPATPCS